VAANNHHIVFFSRAVALAAGIFLFSACAGKTVDHSGDPDYPINLSVYTMAALQQPPADNKIYKWMADNLHVTFTWDILVGDKDQKIGVMVAGSAYPDLLHVDSKRFYEAGALIPLDDLIEKYGPRLKAHYADAWERMKEDDGHVYCLPTWGVYSGRDQDMWYGGPAFFVQKEVLKEAGYPQIKTMDQYFDLLINYRNKHPVINGQPTITFTILAYDWHSYTMINPPNFLAGFPNDGNGTVDPVTHQYKVFLYQDISKRWFKKLNDINALGLIDHSCFIDNYDQYLSKIASGRVLAFHDQAWHFKSAEDTLISQGMINRTYSPLPLVFDEGTRPNYVGQHVPSYGQGLGISINAKDPVRIIRFLDAQLSEDVQKVFSWGIEGEDYFIDDKGQPYRNDEQRKQQDDEVWKLHNQALLWTSENPKIQGSFSDGYPTAIANIYSEKVAVMKPEDKELWDAYGVASNIELMDKDPPPNSVWFPAWQIPVPDGSDAQLGWQRAESVYRKDLPRIIMAPPEQFESLWAEYISDLGKTGLDKYEAYMQSEIDKRIQMWSPKN